MFRLVIFDPDLKNTSALKSAFADLSTVTIEKTAQMLYLSPPGGIDVLYLPLAAAERWGSKPLIHESQVLTTTPEDREQGLPPFIVTGTCLAPTDPRGPLPETTLLVDSAFSAIRAFNDEHDFKLRRVGFWAYNLLKGLTPSQLRTILTRVVPELEAGQTRTNGVE